MFNLAKRETGGQRARRVGGVGGGAEQRFETSGVFRKQARRIIKGSAECKQVSCSLLPFLSKRRRGGGGRGNFLFQKQEAKKLQKKKKREKSSARGRKLSLFRRKKTATKLPLLAFRSFLFHLLRSPVRVKLPPSKGGTGSHCSHSLQGSESKNDAGHPCW